MSQQILASRIAHTYLLRLADTASPGLDAEDLEDDSDRLFSGKARQLLYRAFGRQGLPFFDFYKELHRVWAGWPVPEGGLLAKFLPAYRRVYRTLEGEEAKNQAGEFLSRLKPWIKRIESGGAGTNVWRAVIEGYVQIMLDFGIDQGVWLVTKRLGGSGGHPWKSLWQMPKKQQRLERIKRDDPDLFSTLMESEETRDRLNNAIQRRVAEAGLIPGEEYVVIAGRRVTKGPNAGKLKGYGRPVQTGTDPVTGEVSYYDEDGGRFSRDGYIEAAKERMEALKGLRKVNISEEELDDLRTIPEDVMRKLENKPVRYRALTDDPTKSSALTRIYPIVEVWGVEVVASGRYRGIALPDLVNRAGRQIEGSVYDYDESTGRPVKMETKNPDGTPNIKTERGPYVTVSNGKLFLKIPFRKAKKNDPYSTGTTPQRQAVRKLADSPGSTVEYLKDGQNTTFEFDPKDFAAVRSALGGMTMSNAALKMVKSHFTELAKAELATAGDNLKHYTNEALGGFGEDAHPLTVKQKQALAWLDANGNKGVCALDTGLGKCVREDTLILTNQGMIPIRDMNPGISEPDTTAPVEGWSVLVGEEALPVRNFYFGGPKPTIRVRTRRGYEVEGSRIHPLLVRTPDGQETWVKTPDLEAGDYLCIERRKATFPSNDPALSVPVPEDFQQRSRNSDVTFPSSRAQMFPVPHQMTPDMGRLLGYIIAVGWTNNHKIMSISQCPEKNPEVRADIEDLLQRLLGWTANPEKDIRIHSVFLREYLLRMGVGWGLAKDKTIPETILRSSKETVRQFVRGLIDADGHVNRGPSPHIEFSTASEQMGRELQILLLRFGIMCSRRPKKVKGYEHTYWCITLCGQDAVTYGEQIGFISTRKQATIDAAPETRNSNLDVVPHLAVAVGGLFDTMLAVSGHTTTSLSRQVGSRSFDCTVSHIRRGRRNPTHTFLRRMLSLAVDLGVPAQDPNLVAINKVLRRGFFYDPIEAMEESEAVVMDIEVDDPRHCFVGNGIVNHNTVTSAAIMQKLKRDGLMDDPDAGNGRYLYVCPAALKGNLAKEMEKFLVDPDSILDHVDVMSYAEFRKARGKLSKVPLVNPTGRRKYETKWEATTFGEDYIAVFFDEAQALKNPGSQRSMAAASLNHPRKVLMTASPMERSPMEVYALQAISNNIDLTAKGPRKDMAAFKRRFSETVGGRVVGIKSDDPDTLREFRVWVKRNLYYADKQDPEAILLPELKTDGGTPLGMPEEIESQYKAVAKTIAKELKKAASQQFKPARGAYQRYLNSLPTGTVSPSREEWAAAQKLQGIGLAVESLRMKLGKEFAELTRLSNLPNWTFEDVPAPTGKNPKAVKRVWTRDPTQPNPKVDFAVNKVAEKIASGKTLLFTDSPEMATESVIRMSNQFPGVGHVVGYSSKIELWRNGEVLRAYTPKRYRNFRTGEWYDKTEWKVPVLQSLMAGNDPLDPGGNIPTPSTATLTGSYAVGQNLQMFNTVVHLDRDTWNAETMKQRTARAWRSGQQNSVEEYTLDMTYSDDRKKGDPTLDEVRQTIQEMDSRLFNEVVNQSQSQNLGEEWLTMKQNESELFEVNRQMMEMAMSPYLARMGEEER